MLAASVAFTQSPEPAVALLARKCAGCHNEKTSSSGLSLETRTSVLTGGARGAAVVPGRPRESLMVAAIRQTGTLKMPLGGKLSASEIEIIEQWIAAGAPGLEDPARKAGSNHWASVQQANWVRNSIDRFILARRGKRRPPRDSASVRIGSHQADLSVPGAGFPADGYRGELIGKLVS